MISKVVTVICFLILAGSGYFWYERFIKKCDYPLEYAIGSFDSNFGISRMEFLDEIKKAEKVWEKETGEELFKYVESADFKINLIYDERQRFTQEANESETVIEGTRATYEELYSQYQEELEDYKSNVAEYNAMINEHEREMSEYNSRVQEINAGGGATPADAKQLENEKSYLISRGDLINKTNRQIDQQVGELNLLGRQVNYLARKFNIEVTIHNEEYGQERHFDQGDFRSGEINIYQFDTKSDLELVLAHEFGHALGIDHVETPESIMYYLIGEQNIGNITPTTEDLRELSKVCKL